MSKNLLLFFIVPLLAMSCAGEHVVIDDFESGNLDKWFVDGNAFLSNPMEVKADSRVSGAAGKFYIESKHGAPDSFSALHGEMTSATFDINRRYVNFLIGGSRAMPGCDYAAVELLCEGKVVRSAAPHSSDPCVMEWASWDVEDLMGQKANIRIRIDSVSSALPLVDKFILIDEIALSNKKKSTFNDELSLSITASDNYLLIPSANDGGVSRLSIMSEGRNILGEPQDINVASNHCDYMIPIDISSYKGKPLDVVITSIDSKSLTATGIIQSADRQLDREEPYRQVYHFTPDFGWTNDPNGMVYLDGEYHLAYQANPYGTKHYNMHWGNAVSKDLVHWNDLPFIVAPDELGAIYSGSSVVDKDNSAGFGKNAIVAMYTSASQTQKQSIAYSTDNGRSFVKYEHNPVLFEESRQPDFRDPKLMPYKDKWIVSVAAGDVIAFYESSDLKNWRWLSDFGKGIGSHAAVWECPDLFRFEYGGQEKWVLIVNINPGGPNGGSIAQYFIGDFNGKEFKADNLPYPLWIDEGVDNYAVVTFSNTADRHIALGWMSNWLYSNEVPSRNFRNSMTIARDLSLKHNGRHLFLASAPSPEIYSARAESHVIEVPHLSGKWQLSELLPDNDGAYEIDFTIIPGTDRHLSFKLFNSVSEEMEYDFDFSELTLNLDRSRSGLTDFYDGFGKKNILTHLVKSSCYHVKLFVDRQSTELFINDGDLSFTNCMFPTEVYNSLEFSSSDATIADMTIYKIK